MLAYWYRGRPGPHRGEASWTCSDDASGVPGGPGRRVITDIPAGLSKPRRERARALRRRDSRSALRGECLEPAADDLGGPSCAAVGGPPLVALEPTLDVGEAPLAEVQAKVASWPQRTTSWSSGWFLMPFVGIALPARVGKGRYGGLC